MTGPDTLNEYEEVELLLPWYVTGKLDAADRAKVEALLLREPALRNQLDLIREEQSAAIAVNDGIAAPASLSLAAGPASPDADCSSISAASSPFRRQVRCVLPPSVRSPSS
jgi:anti-sigma factor RsiW